MTFLVHTEISQEEKSAFEAWLAELKANLAPNSPQLSIFSLWIEGFRQSRRSLEAAGYVIVPKEPTEEMVAEVDRRLMALPARERIVDGPARLKTLATVYRFMIEARPK